MSRASAVTALSALRLAVGIGAWLTPRLAGRLFGLDPVGNPQLPYMARLFGIRDVVMAVGTTSSEGETQDTWLRLGLICDVADFAAGLLARRNDEIGPVTAVLVTTPALAGTAMGLMALRADAAPAGS